MDNFSRDQSLFRRFLRITRNLVEIHSEELDIHYWALIKYQLCLEGC